MTSTIKNLNDKITTNLASASDYKTIGQLAGAVDSLSNTTIDCVASTAALPSATDNTGRFVGVGTSSALCYRYSDGYGWRCDYTTTCATVATQLWVWGYNATNELGVGDTTARYSPVTTCGGGADWCYVTAGNSISAGIKTDGTLWTWGLGVWGALGSGSTATRSSPATVAGGGNNWKTVTGGYLGTIGLKTDGTLWTWGYVCAGSSSTGNSPVTICGGGNTWCYATIGGYNVASIKTDGTLWTSGQNMYGQLGNNATVGINSPVTTAGGGTTWCTAASSLQYALAIKTDGTLWGWGRNNCGQLGAGDITDRSSPVTTAGGGTTWCQVAVGCDITHAIKTDGTLWMWGANTSGYLGIGTSGVNISSPVTVAGGGTNWCQVTAGCFHGAGIKTDGTLWGWSISYSNATGCSPVTICGGGNTWCRVDGGRQHYLALKQVYKGF